MIGGDICAGQDVLFLVILAMALSYGAVAKMLQNEGSPSTATYVLRLKRLNNLHRRVQTAATFFQYMSNR